MQFWFRIGGLTFPKRQSARSKKAYLLVKKEMSQKTAVKTTLTNKHVTTGKYN